MSSYGEKTTKRREKLISFTYFTAAPEPYGSMQEPRLTRFMILRCSRKPIEDGGLLPQLAIQNVCFDRFIRGSAKTHPVYNTTGATSIFFVFFCKKMDPAPLTYTVFHARSVLIRISWHSQKRCLQCCSVCHGNETKRNASWRTLFQTPIIYCVLPSDLMLPRTLPPTLTQILMKENKIAKCPIKSYPLLP